jgi:hypothetical protein
MSVACVPPLDEKPWPTLGPQVCAFIEDNLVFGPGDLRGEPAVLDAEKRALIYRMYEVHPQKSEQPGRRRFRRVAISLRKGSAKTELAAWIAACELHPGAPVRCIGWDEDGDPIGGPVTDPYIPLIAYTEQQSEELCYGALLAILEESELAGDFDLGLSRILRKSGAGKAVALGRCAGSEGRSPDELPGVRRNAPHDLASQKQAHRTMLANLPKRKLADPWSLETTTAYSPGEASVAESTHDYARMVRDGKPNRRTSDGWPEDGDAAMAAVLAGTGVLALKQAASVARRTGMRNRQVDVFRALFGPLVARSWKRSGARCRRPRRRTTGSSSRTGSRNSTQNRKNG